MLLKSEEIEFLISLLTPVGTGVCSATFFGSFKCFPGWCRVRDLSWVTIPGSCRVANGIERGAIAERRSARKESRVSQESSSEALVEANRRLLESDTGSRGY